MVKTNVEQKKIQLIKYYYIYSILFLFGKVPPDKLAGVFLSTFKLKKVSWVKEEYFPDQAEYFSGQAEYFSIALSVF
jgi:hypothetical protein